MEVLYERCCGLDVHRNMVLACLSIIQAVQHRKEIRTFRTVTKELLAMRQWLLEESCSHRRDARAPECSGVPSMIDW